MKNKKCPYCGRRIMYSSVFATKNKGTFTCTRCKKESKVKIDKSMLILFTALCLLLVVFMIIWSASGLSNSIWGTIIVAVILLSFYFCIPLFVSFIPLKKHLNEMTTQKTYDEIEATQSTIDIGYTFNKEAFDRIKKQKTAGALVNLSEEEISSQTKVNQRYVPIIENVKEAHSSSDKPLQKIEKPQRTYIPQNEYYQEEEIKEYVPKKSKKPSGNRYTGNRKL